MRIPPPLERIIAALSRLPGIGEKTATRLAFFVLGESKNYATEFASALNDLHLRIRHCSCCHNIAEDELCIICSSPSRDTHQLCVVEGIADLIAIERTGEYKGRYHVLHGCLSPIQGIGPDELKMASLYPRIAAESIAEVILATNVDVEGEATALYLNKRLRAIEDITVSRIASGVPMGGDLEYLDQVTVVRALRGRTSLN
jgi:recombination protein RecR